MCANHYTMDNEIKNMQERCKGSKSCQMEEEGWDEKYINCKRSKLGKEVHVLENKKAKRLLAGHMMEEEISQSVKLEGWWDGKWDMRLEVEN